MAHPTHRISLYLRCRDSSKRSSERGEARIENLSEEAEEINFKLRHYLKLGFIWAKADYENIADCWLMCALGSFIQAECNAIETKKASP
ncbi:hypothetical protein [Granulicella mallensis]|uniref:hypothetical protein n=1 Tax=Granulicella mallensis TaxID=940614 RepID=UPI0012374036|nr:hypothetical protein [Granulicella mallensis]